MYGDELNTARKTGPWMPFSDMCEEYIARNWGFEFHHYDADEIEQCRLEVESEAAEEGRAVRWSEWDAERYGPGWYAFPLMETGSVTFALSGPCETLRECMDAAQEYEDEDRYDDEERARDSRNQYCEAVIFHQGMGSKWMVDPPVEEYLAGRVAVEKDGW